MKLYIVSDYMNNAEKMKDLRKTNPNIVNLDHKILVTQFKDFIKQLTSLM